MDISLQKFKHLFLLLILLGTSFWSQAQIGVTEHKTVFMNEPFKVWAQDVSGFGITIKSNPAHGEIIEYLSGVNGIDTLVYLPNIDFVGVDEIMIEHLTGYPPYAGVAMIHTTFKLTIVPSLVEVQHDYAITSAGKPLTLKVIDNDTTSHEPLSLDPIFPVVNHGVVEKAVEAGFAKFTPEPGYTGLADFNYIVCDSKQTCKTGSVTIHVNPEGATFNDAIHLATGENTDKTVPMPFHVLRVEPSTNVRVENSRYAIVYKPAIGFTGTETFTVFGENGNQREVIMDVIERPINATSLANDDIAYAALGESITIDVLANDGIEGTARAIDFYSPRGGEIVNQLGGSITFVPDEGFSGVARILYRLFDSDYNEHKAYVYIVYDRNNFGPNVRDHEYVFQVNPGKSKLIEYNAPIDGYRLLPSEGFPIVGTLEAYANQTVNVNGQDVAVKGAVLYRAPEEAGVTDQFEVSYCPPGVELGDCQKIKIKIEVVNTPIADCVTDCVYPGDLNADGIVNSVDLLPLGLYAGKKGPARADQSTTFTPHPANNWSRVYQEEGTINIKHYDANGDGVVTEADADAIRNNYGKVNQLIPNSLPALSKGISITPKRVVPNPEEIPVGGVIPAGTRVEVDIVVGEAVAQELDLYGFTFPFKLSGKSLIDPGSFSIEFKEGGWAALNAPTLSLAQDIANSNADEYKFDLAFTRTSGIAVSGNGPVATVGFVVIENLEGVKLPDEKVTLDLEVGSGYAIDGKGQYYTYEGSEASISFSFEQKEEEDLVSAQLEAYPNPAGERLNINLNSFNYTINTISIINITGQEVYRISSLDTKYFPVPVHQLPEGLYIANVQTDGGVLSKKFEVLRQ